MNKQARWLNRAYADADEAFIWYQTQSAGLGNEFLVALENSVAGIEKHPEAWPRVFAGFHRYIVERFPYSIFYKVQPSEIVIHGVFHHAENPRKLRRRLRDG